MTRSLDRPLIKIPMEESQKKLNDAASELSSFIERERMRFDIEQNNLFAFRFYEITKCLQYLALTYERYLSSLNQYVKSHKALADVIDSHRSEGVFEMSAKEHKIYLESRSASNLLQLDIETIYVWLTTLLDFLAKATQYYFGSGKRENWRSFASMSKHFQNYLKEKGLAEAPARLITLAEDLHQSVSKFRSDYIIHKDEREHLTRLVTGFTYNKDFSEIRLAPGVIYPRDGESEDVRSKPPEELFELLCNFIKEWLAYLEGNTTAAHHYSSS